MVVRSIVAVVVGVFAAGGIIAAVEFVGHSLVGDTSGGALFAIVAAGYGLGALGASAIANRIARTAWPALVACVLLAALAVSNLFVVAHPVWFVPVGAVLMLGGYVTGRKLLPLQGLSA